MSALESTMPNGSASCSTSRMPSPVPADGRKRPLFRQTPDGGCLRGLLWAFGLEAAVVLAILLALYGMHRLLT